MGEILYGVLVFVQILYYTAEFIKVARDLRSGHTRINNEDGR